MNVYLIGFMGSGKTAVGKCLADKLKLKFIDLDDIIEAREDRKIKDIFTQHGEPYFRRKEKEAVRDISQEQNLVVATGGGVVVDPENLVMLKKSGVLIYLHCSPDVVFKRTKDQSQRPLLNIKEPKKKIKDLLDKRAAYYAKADYKIDTSSKSIEEVAQEAINILETHKDKNL